MNDLRKHLSWVWLPLALAGACSGAKAGTDPVDPLETRSGFCERWGKSACSAEVVDRCLAADATVCAESQTVFCETILPGSGYSKQFAQVCLNAVKAAYADAELTREEHDTVIDLGPPCDKLIEGPGQVGDACSGKDSDCNTLEDLKCVARPGETGTCQVPTIVGGGRSCRQLHETCEEGFFCNGENCIERLGEGSLCSASAPCAEDLKCEGPDGAQTCVPKAELGGPCGNENDCVTGLCAKAPGAVSGVCDNKIILTSADPLCENLR
jgi:hypothetical protein